jgi:hypothetical protein
MQTSTIPLTLNGAILVLGRPGGEPTWRYDPRSTDRLLKIEFACSKKI